MSADKQQPVTVCDSANQSQALQFSQAVIISLVDTFAFLPSIDLSLLPCIPSPSSPISSVTPPPCLLPQLPFSSEFILWSDLLSSLVSSLRSSLPTLKVSLGVSIKSGVWELVSVQFVQTVKLQFIVRGLRKVWTYPFFRSLQGAQKASSRAFLQACFGKNGG